MKNRMSQAHNEFDKQIEGLAQSVARLPVSQGLCVQFPRMTWPVLVRHAGLCLMLAGQVTAQTFTSLYSFTATPSPPFVNNDGALPFGRLILSGNTLYGTARTGGNSGGGTVFAVSTDGSSFRTLHSFTNSDGALPQGGLILSGNTLYGTTPFGGSSGNGTVFAVNTDGSSFSTLHSFTPLNPLGTNADGANPIAGLTISGNTLYGTAQAGGSSGNGSVFKISTDGTTFTTLHSFSPRSGSFQTNSDGASPYASLILSGNTLFGTAQVGGSLGSGTVFSLNIDGTGFTVLHSFTTLAETPYTNRDGGAPGGTLVLSGNALYGTASEGGSWERGTLFKLNTDGTGFTTLHSFTAASGSGGDYGTNSDGINPLAGLILSGDTLYGTAPAGGTSGYGTVFSINTNGAGFTTLYSFTPPDPFVSTNSDGIYPYAGLTLSGNFLYGAAHWGGESGNGTVFALSLPVPRLTIIRSGSNFVLTWPTNATDFTLQSTTNLVRLEVWTTVSPGPLIAGGQNAVTNPVSGTLRFYRLSR
jgi:uncharacterized repeat protein (TIGR03803 family)